MIYFIEYAGQIKVGFASNVDRRLNEFKTAIPSFVRLGSMEGTRDHERAIHEELKPYRLKGEWFKDCPEVRAFLMRAMSEGIEAWQPARPRHTPTMWDERAKRLSEIICAGRSCSEFDEIEKELSIPPKTLWALRYRQSREVSVGEFFALLSAAREATTLRRAELDRAEAFIADLEREETEKAGSLLVEEARLISLQRARS